MKKRKWIRNYKIEIVTPDNELITIEPPFTAVMNVTRNTLASVNKGSLTLFNLPKETRNKIYKDRYTFTEYWQLTISAGYGKDIKEIFKGNIYESQSFKQKTDWITRIEGFDGLHAIQNGFISQSVNKNTSQRIVFKNIIKTLPNTIKGFFGSKANETNDRGKALLGQSSDVLATESDGKYFIDNEVVNIVDDDEYLVGQILELDSDQLLSTPRRRKTFLDVDILFEPSANIGLLCELNSLIKLYNGIYKIMGFSHSFTVSQAISGKATTNISLYAGAEGLREVSS